MLHNMRLGKAAVAEHSEAGKCGSNSKAMTALLQNKVEDMGVPCEDMCKKMGAYPNCQCPEHPCPTEEFVTCTKELTTVSVLQWDTVFSHVSQSLDAMLHNMRLGKAAVAEHSETGKCGSNSKAITALLQNKVEDMGVPCEDMCKKT